MNQQIAFYEDKAPEAAKSIDELLAMMPDGEPYQAAWKCWYMIRDHEKIMCSVSGGWDSDIMLDLIVRCGGKAKTTFCFFDTGLEYDATKRHIEYLEERYGIRIKELKPKKVIPACCREYGVPFWSKSVSEMIHRLQRNGFRWEDEPFDVLLERYPRCKAALRWWCDKWGEGSKFNISRVSGLKEFVISNPPEVPISSMCCSKAKKEPAYDEEESGYDLNCIGVRKAEGGVRSTGLSSCFDQKQTGPNRYRPLFWWSDSDKEAYTKRFGIVRSDCYEEWGMDRTGCAGCPFGKRFEQELELVRQHEPKRYRAMISVFGESYEYIRRFLEFRRQMGLKKSWDKETHAGQTKMEGF